MSTAVLADPDLSKSGQVELVKHGSAWYRCGDQLIIRGLDDEHVAYAYARFKAEGLLPILYYENPDIRLYDFMAHFLNPATNTLGCFHIKPDGSRMLCGMGWTTETTHMGLNHSRAGIGEGFFRGFAGFNFLVRFGQMMLAWIFDTHPVDALWGSTPAKNRAAVIYARKMGMQVVGPIAGGTVWGGELCDVWLSSMTRQQWREMYPFVDLHHIDL